MTNAREPLVSVIIPTRDRVALLRQAVASVVAQSYRTWELIVIDDGSIDATPGYLATLSESRIRFIRHDRCGNPAKLRNVGVKDARGEHVAFLDSDDVWHPEKLARQVDDLRIAPPCRWGYTYFRWIDAAGMPLAIPRIHRRRASRGWILSDVLSVRAWVATPVVMVERDLLLSLGGFDESLVFAEDFDLWVRLARASPATLVAQALTSVRQHSGNSWRSRRAEYLRSWSGVYARIMGDPDFADVQGVCLREYTRAVVYLADQLRADDAPREALATLRGVARRGVTMPPWWFAFIKTVLRPWAPRPVLAAYRWVHGVLRQVAHRVFARAETHE